MFYTSKFQFLPYSIFCIYLTKYETEQSNRQLNYVRIVILYYVCTSRKLALIFVPGNENTTTPLDLITFKKTSKTLPFSILIENQRNTRTTIQSEAPKQNYNHLQ